MPHRPLPRRVVERTLLKHGFRLHSIRGSHAKYVRADGDAVRVAIVPRHSTVAAGTVRSIARQAGIPAETFFGAR